MLRHGLQELHEARLRALPRRGEDRPKAAPAWVTVAFSHSGARSKSPWWPRHSRGLMSTLDPEQLEIDPRKVRDYLLAPEHPEGGPKAAFFLALGFARERPWELSEALRELAGSYDAQGPITSEHGAKFIVDGILRGAAVRTVWIVDPPSSRVRFVTAYPRRPPS